MKVLLLLALVALAHSASLDCTQFLRSIRFSENFNETIAHAIHSMTVEGLKIFNPRATERNSIPTVNLDRSSSQKVLPYAPSDPVGSEFSTHSMNLIDKILSEIGNPKDGLGPMWSPVERIAHNFHMWDLWNRIKQIYDEKVKLSPPTDAVCSCLLDTKSNGIYKVYIVFYYIILLIMYMHIVFIIRLFSGSRITMTLVHPSLSSTVPSLN